MNEILHAEQPNAQPSARITAAYPQPVSQGKDYTVEERKYGSRSFIAFRARSSEWSVVSTEQAVGIGKNWVNAFSDSGNGELELPATRGSYTLEKNVKGTLYTGLSAGGAQMSYFTPEEALTIGNEIIKKYGPSVHNAVQSQVAR